MLWKKWAPYLKNVRKIGKTGGRWVPTENPRHRGGEKRGKTSGEIWWDLRERGMVQGNGREGRKAESDLAASYKKFRTGRVNVALRGKMSEK